MLSLLFSVMRRVVSVEFQWMMASPCIRLVGQIPMLSAMVLNNQSLTHRLETWSKVLTWSTDPLLSINAHEPLRLRVWHFWNIAKQIPSNKYPFWEMCIFAHEVTQTHRWDLLGLSIKGLVSRCTTIQLCQSCTPFAAFYKGKDMCFLDGKLTGGWGSYLPPMLTPTRLGLD